jgi:Serine incorporator (Serinc)
MGALVSFLALNAFECAAFAGLSCLASLLNYTLSQASRAGHLLIIFVTFMSAIVIAKSYENNLDQYFLHAGINLSSGCRSSMINDCVFRQLMYRASLSLVTLFSLLAVTSYFFEFPNKGMWVLKFSAALGSFVGFCWVDNRVFTVWSDVARVLSFFWLLAQGLLFLDFAHESHDVLMAVADDDLRERGTAREVYALYILLSAGFLTCSGVGLGYLFKDHSGCPEGLAFTVITLLMGLILTLISLLTAVNKGLLTPCLMFAYSVFFCWYAMVSSPNEKCLSESYGNSTWAKDKVLWTCLLSHVDVVFVLN